MFSAFSQEKEISKPKTYNNDLRRANAYFDRAFYAKAIPLYQKINSKNRTSSVIEKLATCYYNIGDLKASARLYGYLVNRAQGAKTESNIFKYIQALKASGNYNDANSVMREYLEEKGDQLTLKAFDADVKIQENIIALGNRYRLENLALNTENSEFGVVPYNDFLVYAAAKKEVQKRNILKPYYGWNDEPFLDIYKIHKDSLVSGNTVSKSISNKVNTKLHEGTVAFSKNGKTMYFTRNNYYKNKEVKDDKLVTHLKLYKANLIDGIWDNIEPLPFNGNHFSVEHPALSHDGKRLYFSSDMPGTLGGFDLFYVDIKNDGTYSDPVNLGTTINTKYREQFPFIAHNGDLYFSSNGHFGFGGLDVFWSKLKADNFQKPDNIGLPLNSGYDDFAFFLDNTLKAGYVSSNRIQGKGSDDIYSFKELKPLIIEDCKQYITGVITDRETNETISNSKVTMTLVSKKTDALIGTYITKENGVFKDTVECEITVVIKATANGYQDAERKITIGNKRYFKNDASMALVSLLSIEKKKQEQAQIAQQKQQEKDRLELERQKKNDLEKQQRADEKRITEAENKKKQIQSIIDLEPHIKREKDKVVIKIEDINFDYKLWYIRKDAKKILKPVVDLMRKYPKMQIEINSHTDIRGNEAYNKDLSLKRATSTKAYLVSKGVDSQRISAFGYGESKPIQTCVTDDACSEAEHEINRRSEFVIKQLL